MDKIEIKSLDVQNTFQRVFVDMTKKLLSIEMEEILNYQGITAMDCSFLIRTEGAFVSIMQFHMEEQLYEEIAATIYKRQMLTEQEKKLYVTEYLNIVCGRFLSEINNILGCRSKLSVPLKVKNNRINKISGHRVKLSYQCPYGIINIIIYFDKIE